MTRESVWAMPHRRSSARARAWRWAQPSNADLAAKPTRLTVPEAIASAANPTYKQMMHNGIIDTIAGHARRDRSFVQTENANHRTDHAVVGALVARVWRLAPTVMCAIRLHHDLHTLGDAGIEPEVHTLVAAGLVAEHLMRRHECLGAESDWVLHSERVLGWLQVGAGELEAWYEPLEPLLDDA